MPHWESKNVFVYIFSCLFIKQAWNSSDFKLTMALLTRDQKCIVSKLFQFLSRIFYLGHLVCLKIGLGFPRFRKCNPGWNPFITRTSGQRCGTGLDRERLRDFVVITFVTRRFDVIFVYRRRLGTIGSLTSNITQTFITETDLIVIFITGVFCLIALFLFVWLAACVTILGSWLASVAIFHVIFDQ